MIQTCSNDFNKFILHLNERSSITFVCKNATTHDLNVIMFEWSLFEIFQSKSYLYEPSDDSYSFYDSIQDMNTYCNNIIYQFDVNSSCTFPFTVKSEYQVSSSDNTLNSSKLSGNKQNIDYNDWDPAPPDFFDTHEQLTYCKRYPFSHNREFLARLEAASKPTAIIEVINEIIKNGFGDILEPINKADYSTNNVNKRNDGPTANNNNSDGQK